jgi:hypothetical protein
VEHILFGNNSGIRDLAPAPWDMLDLWHKKGGDDLHFSFASSLFCQLESEIFLLILQMTDSSCDQGVMNHSCLGI